MTTSESNVGQVNPYLNLEQLVARLQQLQDSKVDFVADARALGVIAENKTVRIVPQSPQVAEWLPADGFPLTQHAIAQLYTRLTPPVPTGYGKLLLDQNPEAASMLISNTRPASRWFVRSIDGYCRAVLSDKYLAIDHIDLATSALDSVKQANGRVLYCALDDSRMKISITTKEVFDVLHDAESNRGSGGHRIPQLDYRDEGDGQPGKVNPLVTITNSETGEGGLTIRFGLLVVRCVNGVIIETALDKIHVGSRMDNTYSSLEQRKHQALTLHYGMRDAIRAGIHPNTFGRMVAKANKATQTVIEAPAAAATNVLTFAGLFSDSRLDQLMDHFRAYSRTSWGLSQATSRLAQDMDSVADVDALESAAGALVNAKVKLTA